MFEQISDSFIAGILQYKYLKNNKKYQPTDPQKIWAERATHTFF